MKNPNPNTSGLIPVKPGERSPRYKGNKKRTVQVAKILCDQEEADLIRSAFEKTGYKSLAVWLRDLALDESKELMNIS